MGERAQHPAQGVAHLAVGLDEGFQDFLADPKVVRIVRGRDPEAQDIRARFLDDALRRRDIAQRLGHFLPLLIEAEAVRQHHVIGRATARAAAFEQRGMEPPPMLVRAFEIHHGVGAAVHLAVDARKAGEVDRIFQHVGMGRA